jgi:hypothetical protein
LEDGVFLSREPERGCLRMREDGVLTAIVAHLSTGGSAPSQKPTNCRNECSNQPSPESHLIFLSKATLRDDVNVPQRAAAYEGMDRPRRLPTAFRMSRGENPAFAQPTQFNAQAMAPSF